MAAREQVATPKQVVPPMAQPAPDTVERCPKCNTRRITQPVGEHRLCRDCKHEWDV